MIYSLPNTYISLPETHILSPRFYAISPFLPSRDSLYLQVYSTSSALALGASSDSSFVKCNTSTTNSEHKCNNAMSLRALNWTIGRFELSLKQLFVSLHLWKSDTLSAAQVSDVFVRLATDFNATIALFASYEIFVSEFSSFEDNLREVLEPNLSEPPSSPNFHKCISGLEAVLADVLPPLASKHMAVKKMLV